MTIKLEIVVGDVTYDITDRYVYHSNTGWGLTGVKNYSQTGYGQKGSTFTGDQIQPRSITLVIGINASSTDEYYSQRVTLMNIFKPKKFSPMYLRVTHTADNGEVSVRQFRVFYQEGLSFDGGDKDGFYHKVGISLMAYEPFWYDPIGDTAQFQQTTAQGFKVPMRVPTSVGQSALDQSITIEYEGTADTEPVITLIGPMTGFTLTNETTGDVLKINGTVEPLMTYTIDTRYGVKSVTDQNGNNRISQYEGDLSTFNLVASEDTSTVRPNTLRVSASATTSATRIIVQYFPQYVGV